MTLETPPTSPAPDEPAAARVCPRCGTALTPEQEWCLSCGADVGARVAATPRWRIPVAVVGVLVVAALAAVVLALVELARDDPQVAQTTPPPVVATPTATAPAGEQPAPGEQGSTPGAQVPEASDDQTAGQSTPTPTATPSPTTTGEGQSGNGQSASGQTGQTGNGQSAAGQAGAIADWPAGRTAWTVILESATSKSAAETKARDLSGQGVTVGVLHSDDFSSLRSGYWVVFSGQYDSRSAADDAATGLKSKVPEAYARHVVPG